MCQCRFNVRVLGCFFALDMRAFMNDSAEPRVIIYAYDAVRVIGASIYPGFLQMHGLVVRTCFDICVPRQIGPSGYPYRWIECVISIMTEQLLNSTSSSICRTTGFDGRRGALRPRVCIVFCRAGVRARSLYPKARISEGHYVHSLQIPLPLDLTPARWYDGGHCAHLAL